jgi:formylglycine-generating enzyme required for sulfatase activity
MVPALQDLIARLDHLSDGFAELREGVRKAMLVADLDPDMALTRARKVLEYVVRDVFDRRVKEPPGTRPLENLLQRLVKDGHFPEKLDAYANTVRKLGNVGTHNFGERITAGDVYHSLTQLMPILEWYFEVERPDCGMPRTAPVARAREPGSASPPSSQSQIQIETRTWTQAAVVPKGLRSFDAADSSFFLTLLPGPRDHEGLPESLRFWKYRIEETREPTFAVGVIYGPSGCGKSSLVKAGLLPRLARDVVAVYVEATADETEARLLAGLRKRLPGLAAGLDLTQTLTALRQGEGLNARQRIVLVLDQFEQWLHAHRGQTDTALARALRQCDGEELRCVLMVRDDFWMALTRFLDDLGIELLQNQNAAAVDLFDPIHARNVLIAFGQAFGRLPDDSGLLTTEQLAFLDQAIAWLAQDGRVISIRLTLFAEMVKGKPWTRATLAEAGNMERIGVAFLDETFRAPALRLHEKPAQAVLKALLPERGTDIKGQMRSHHELRTAAGDSLRPEEFEALLKTLDREVRLITPTEPGGPGNGERKPPAAPDGRFYQLTHDYLVPSLRDWLNRKQRETRRGRAELRLAERASLWNARPENRLLPSEWEWCRIRLYTNPKEWTEPQRRMMRTAARVHGLRTLGLVVAGVLLLVLGLTIRRREIAYVQQTYATELVEELLRAETPEVPDIITEAEKRDCRRWVERDLRQRLPKLPDDSHQKLNASLALLPDEGQVEYLYQRLLSASPTELPVLRDALNPYQSRLIPRLWPVLDSAGPGDPRVLPAAAALARYDPDGLAWATIGRKVGDALVAINPVYLGSWTKDLRPVRATLTDPLAAIFRDTARPESERTQAVNILAAYNGDQPAVLADLLMDADKKPFLVLFEKLRAHPTQRAVSLLEAELAKTPALEATLDAQDQHARRQARAAVALARLGQVEPVWPLLRHSADPSVRSFLVHWLRLLATDPKVLAARLGELARAPSPAPPVEGTTPMEAILFDPVTSSRRALILALGEYAEDLAAPMRDELAAKLLDAYRNDRDAGIHGAAEWTLRQWHQDEAIKKADAELRHIKDWGNRRWLVDSEGHTLTVVEGPVRFTMGSPPTERRRSEDEVPHLQRINRRFAIATKEVTREQYERFVHANPKHRNHGINGTATSAPDLQEPQVETSWYDAAAYCNWLSEQEKLEPCYEPNEKREYAEGMRIAADFRKRSGYRLPTETEWEYVCRAGAATSRYYGRALDLLGNYACYLQNSPEPTVMRCGRKKPNDLGLFDILGNAYEWCQDQNRAYGPDEGDAGDDDIGIDLSLADKNLRLLRGGSFTSPAASVRAAYRVKFLPSNRNIWYGFRVARTYP